MDAASVCLLCIAYCLLVVLFFPSSVGMVIVHDFDFSNKSIYSSKDLSQLKGVTFGSLNICSAYRKTDDMLTILNNSEFDYFSITESWLNNSISDDDLYIDGYNITRFDRDDGKAIRGGGGILIYTAIKAKRDFRHVAEWNLCCPDCEWVWLTLNLPDTRRTYICTLYRPPSGSVENFLNLLENKIMDIYSDENADVLILGDMNINWSDSKNHNRRKYANLLKILNRKNPP